MTLTTRTTTTLGEEPRFAARSDLVKQAHRIAADAHEGQLRKDDGSPYITHPVSVAALVDDAGYDDEVVAAALLHDVVEDTNLDPDEIEEIFGEHVSDLVEALSDNERILDFAERKRHLRAEVAEEGDDAIAIFIADKLSNLRDMRRIYAEDGEAIAPRFKASLDTRVEVWREDLKMAKAATPGLPYLADFERELDGFAAEREELLSEAA